MRREPVGASAGFDLTLALLALLTASRVIIRCAQAGSRVRQRRCSRCWTSRCRTRVTIRLATGTRWNGSTLIWACGNAGSDLTNCAARADHRVQQRLPDHHHDNPAGVRHVPDPLLGPGMHPHRHHPTVRTARFQISPLNLDPATTQRQIDRVDRPVTRQVENDARSVALRAHRLKQARGPSSMDACVIVVIVGNSFPALQNTDQGGPGASPTNVDREGAMGCLGGRGRTDRMVIFALPTWRPQASLGQ